MTHKVVIIIMLLGIWLLASEIGKRSVKCPTNKVVVRYIPRTPEEEERNQVYVSDMFKDMFKKPSPWIATSTDEYLFKREL